MSSKKCVIAVAYFMGTELTNVLMNTRWFLNELKISGFISTTISITLLFTFFITRVLPIPAVVKLMWASNYAHFTTIEKIFTAFVVAPLGLNGFWFYLMCEAARQSLSASKAI